MKQGFSLLEITIVIFISVAILGVALPRIPLLFESPLERETKKFAVLIHRLRMEAILNGKTICIILDPEHEKYTVGEEIESDSTENKCPALPGFPHITKLSPSIKILKITTGIEKLQTYDISTVKILIDPVGFMDIFSIYFHKEKNIQSVSIVNLSGKTIISDVHSE